MLALCDGATAANRQAWLERAAAVRSGWYQKYQPQLASGSVPIRPERICAELSEHVPADAVVMVDTGHAGMWMGGMYDLSDSAQGYIRSAGHLGWAFPAGLGAKCAVPDRPVITFTGDAGIWYHIAELETAVRWRINAITIVNNNSSGNQSRAGFDRVYGNQQGQTAANCGPLPTSVSRRSLSPLGLSAYGLTSHNSSRPRFFGPWKPAVLWSSMWLLISMRWRQGRWSSSPGLAGLSASRWAPPCRLSADLPVAKSTA